jgi:hypothetical protein
MGGLADTLDPIAVGDDPAGVQAPAGRPVQAVARAPKEFPTIVVGDHGLDIVAEQVLLALDDA